MVDAKVYGWVLYVRDIKKMSLEFKTQCLNTLTINLRFHWNDHTLIKALEYKSTKPSRRKSIKIDFLVFVFPIFDAAPTNEAIGSLDFDDQLKNKTAVSSLLQRWIIDDKINSTSFSNGPLKARSGKRKRQSLFEADFTSLFHWFFWNPAPILSRFVQIIIVIILAAPKVGLC